MKSTRRRSVRKVVSLLRGGLEAKDARSVGTWSYLLMGGREEVMLEAWVPGHTY